MNGPPIEILTHAWRFASDSLLNVTPPEALCQHFVSIGFGLVSLFTDVWNFRDYLLPKVSLWWYLYPIAGKNEKVHLFHKSISLKIKIIAWLEFELVYSDVIDQHISHDAVRNPLCPRGNIYYLTRKLLTGNIQCLIFLFYLTC